MFNILVTGVGSIIGYGIIESLKQSAIHTCITGTDIYKDAYGRVLSDHFVTGVKAESNDFIPFINKVVEEYKIDLIIPGIEQDLYKLWEFRDKVTSRIVLNSDLCTRLSKDKYETFLYLSQFDIRLIPTLRNSSFHHCAQLLGLPFLLKPSSSYASKGIETISTEKEFEFYTTRNEGKCIYQKITGTSESEFTVAVFGDGNGSYFDHIILKRTLSGEGATQKAILVHDEDISEYVDQLCQIIKPAGPTNIQVRKEGKDVYLLEVNPRISSACSIRTLMGYNEPEMCLKYFLLQEDIKPAEKVRGSVVRYISDNFIPYENSSDFGHTR
ncbi:MAG: ATP-grasp domain-containing protein [Bacteroidia bacterium]|nr:ATP-grasp domain-containing protein [Bacteroidia bacterium]